MSKLIPEDFILCWFVTVKLCLLIFGKVISKKFELISIRLLKQIKLQNFKYL